MRTSRSDAVKVDYSLRIALLRGRRCRIVPELDLVVVVTAEYYQDYSPQAFKVQSDIFKDVLRGISPSG